jgi:uncharacterized protein (TIGR02246 family)
VFRNPGLGYATGVTPDDLVELEALRQLKARYFRCMDQKNWDAWGALFTEDATLDTSQDAPDTRVTGRDAIVAMVSAAVHQAVTVHHGHMSELRLTGPDRAEGIWAMEDYLEFPGDPPALVVHGRGHYEETYRKEADGVWRIASLKLTRLWLAHNGRRVIPPPG